MRVTSDVQQLAEGLDITHLPFVLMKDKTKLPDVAGVYFVESRGVILYVGMTESSLYHRWSSHHRNNQIESQFVDPKIIYYICSEDTARDLETALIRKYNPLLQNTTIKPYSREDIGTEVLPQVEDGDIHIKLESIIAMILELKNVTQQLDRSTVKLGERVERLEDLTNNVLKKINK